MANPCAPNASIGNPTFANIVIFDGVKIVNFFLSVGMGWLSNIGGVVPSTSYDLGVFCATEPSPAFDWTDAGAVANMFNPLNPTGAAELRSAVLDTFEHYLWYQVCQCSSGPALTPPAPISEPPGWQINPPSLTGDPLNTPCATAESLTNYVFTDSSTFYTFGLGPATMPVNPTSIVCHFANVTFTGAGRTIPVELQADSGFGPLFGPIVSWSLAPGQTKDLSYDWQPNQRTIHVKAGPATGGGGTAILWGNLATTRFPYSEMWCNGEVPGSKNSPCCPPDPQVYSMLQQILNSVTMQQRYRLPFAYIESTSHSALTGRGSFSVQGLLGVKILVTSYFGSTGEEEGTPNYLFDMGWLSILTGDGVIEETRVHAEQQLWFPQSMPQAITLGYSLNPGVQVTLSELKPES